MCVRVMYIQWPNTRRVPDGTLTPKKTQNLHKQQQIVWVCACLTTPTHVDHAADSRADVRRGGCCDCYSIFCPRADIYHINLWKQEKKEEEENPLCTIFSS